MIRTAGGLQFPESGGAALARTNFSFKKRQQEIERKKKQEEKRQRKLAKKAENTAETPSEAEGGDTPVPESAPAEASDATGE